ncbi:MAG: xanthine dehydrogenase family protein molybdopterin-binding subunit, partial [Stellaceae bacterium]
MGQFGIGQPVPREEDPYLLRGEGRYCDDVRALGAARAHAVRSPHAHARIVSIDATAARAAPGVLRVLTGEDAAVKALGRQSPRMPRKRRDGSPGFIAPQPALADGRVRYVGECVAFVIAETLTEAKDAAELVQVEYAPLPAVVATDCAVERGAAAVWEDCPDNQAWFHAVGNKAAVEAAFAKAAHLVRHRMAINRVTANSMEPRAALAEFDRHEDRYIIRCTVQAPHRTRGIFAQLLKVPETQIRVICENMGGGFGMKGALYSEYVLTALAARLVGRPVKWVAERSEGLLSDEHARDNVTEAELALDKDGRFLGLKVRTLANIGAYHTSDRAAGPPLVNLGVLAGT